MVDKARATQTSLKTLELIIHIKVEQSSYRPEVPSGFREVKVPRFSDNGTG